MFLKQVLFTTLFMFLTTCVLTANAADMDYPTTGQVFSNTANIAVSGGNSAWAFDTYVVEAVDRATGLTLQTATGVMDSGGDYSNVLVCPSGGWPVSPGAQNVNITLVVNGVDKATVVITVQ